ncbi:MAG: dihydrolipoyl dehydrogenase [Sphaerochaetaceae bacterium]|jgi:dihydrolipoamide dehydrogenase
MEKVQRDLVVLGGGPGGYSAAFRAADLGREVTLIEKGETLGGVCLNRGCIPSKSLLHLSEVLADAKSVRTAGITFAEPTLNLDEIRSHKEQSVTTLTNGLDQLVKVRNVERIVGEGKLASNTSLVVSTSEKTYEIEFTDLIVATGSRPATLPFIPYEDPRVWDSTKALELPFIPKHLVVLGGGIIGMEMAAIYHALGSEITIVEVADGIIPPADRDIRQVLMKNIKKEYKAILTKSKVSAVEPTKEFLRITVDGPKESITIESDALLVAVGRKANSDTIDIEKSSIATNEKGWIITNEKQQTNVKHIYAIGDVTGDPMLAHRATYQAKVAAEVASNLISAFTPLGIPSVAYTQPELAWVGLTETEAKEKDIPYIKGAFPWQASGRAITSMQDSGVSKILFDPETKRVLGAGIAGKNAGELIGEAIIALEMGSVAEDLALAIHPHPTLNETLSVAAQLAEGTATDLTNR